MEHQSAIRMLIRGFDIFFSIIAMILLSPICILLAVCILLGSKGGVFYTQERVGKDSRDFRLIKFRTMITGASLQGLLTIGENDQRITRCGHFLRSYKMDEMPQLINIIKGEMSFVGPRPFMISDLKLLKKNDWEYYKLRESFNSKPGITGLWQIFCNRDEGAKNLIALEKIYKDMQSFKYDLKILLYTIPVVLTANNADAFYSASSFPINSPNETEINFVFEKSTSKKRVESEYSLRMKGEGWIDTNIHNSELPKDSNLKLIKIMKNVKRVV